MTPRGVKKIKLTFLKDFKPVSRDTFIKRMKLYLFDLNYDGVYSMTELFESYKEYREEEIGDENESDEDYEGLYLMLEKILYSYGLQIERVFDYLFEQFGSLLDFECFYRWFCYIELVKNGSKDYFPFNLLFSYNCLLVEGGMKPILYSPNSCNVRYEENKRMIISGIFPKDYEGNICFDWVGIWCENVGEIHQIKREKKDDEYSYEEKILKRFGININISFYIELKPNSKVYFSCESKRKENKWRLIYSGPQVLEFNHKFIVESREKMKLTQKELCDMCNINIRSYQRIEAGTAIPDAVTLLKLIDCLDIDNTKNFIKRDYILDPDYKKYNSGLAPSFFENNEERSKQV